MTGCWMLVRKWLVLLLVVGWLVLLTACTEDPVGNDIDSDDLGKIVTEANVHMPDSDELDHDSHAQGNDADMQSSEEELESNATGLVVVDFDKQETDKTDVQSDSPDNSNVSVNDEGQVELREESDELPEVFQQYIEESITMIDDDYVVAFAIGDLDLDGHEEAVIGVGNSSTYFNKAFLLKNQEGTVTSIQDGSLGSPYGIYELKLVELDDRPNPVIYMGVTNGGPMGGFQLEEYINGELKTLVYSASAVGAGSDRLIDGNGDGRYDSYIQERWSYDVFYYWTNRYYKLEQGEFILDHVEVHLPDYPDKPEEVVIEYLSLTMLNETDSPEVAERLSTICPNCSDTLKADLANRPLDWYSFAESLQVTMGEDEQTAEVTLATHEEANSGEIFRFQLYQEESQWKIESYEMVEVAVK
mgnify:CR=1 FL=1